MKEESRPEAALKSLDGDYSKDTEVGPRTTALGFTSSDIEASRRKGERIERRRRARASRREWDAKRHQDDVLAGLRAVWRVTVPEDRPAVERLAERVREGVA